MQIQLYMMIRSIIRYIYINKIDINNIYYYLIQNNVYKTTEKHIFRYILIYIINLDLRSYIIHIKS
jgi:hypothetical protein